EGHALALSTPKKSINRPSLRSARRGARAGAFNDDAGAAPRAPGRRRWPTGDLWRGRLFPVLFQDCVRGIGVNYTMALRSYGLAIGKFSEELRDHLEYPQSFYEGVRTGCLVFSELFHCKTTRESKELAGVLGVSIWDFDSHLISPSEITPGN